MAPSYILGISAFYLQLQAALQSIQGELLQWWGQAASLCYLDAHGGPYVNPDAAFYAGIADRVPDHSDFPDGDSIRSSSSLFRLPSTG